MTMLAGAPISTCWVAARPTCSISRWVSLRLSCKGVTGDYCIFPYPYLVEVPNYHVTITPPLPAGERKKNLDTLKFIAREAGARGLEFQLAAGIYAWQWTDSPHSDHVINGLNGADGKADWKLGAAYSRDALAILLKECPEITGVTLRVHGESGVPEGNSCDFWQTLFEPSPASPQDRDRDNAKGINQIMIGRVKTASRSRSGPNSLPSIRAWAITRPTSASWKSPRPSAWSRGCSPSPMVSGASPVTAMPIFIRKGSGRR